MTLVANITVPKGAPVGGYEGGIYISEHKKQMDKLAESKVIPVTAANLTDTDTTTTNDTIATTPISQVTNRTVANTTMRHYNGAVVNTKLKNYTDVSGTPSEYREFLANPVSKSASDTIVNTASTQITGEYLGSIAMPVQIIDDYLGIANASTYSMPRMPSLQSGSTVVQGSVTIYKTGAPWTNDTVVSSVANETVSINFKNDAPLKLAHRLVVPGTYAIYRAGNRLVEGANYTLDPITGNITVININAVGGVAITATYKYHSDYLLDGKTGILSFAYKSNKGAISADYNYYTPLAGATLDCGGNPSAVLANSGCNVYRNGEPLVLGIDYTIDSTNKSVKFLGDLAPNSWLTADYKYYVPAGLSRALSYGGSMAGWEIVNG